MYPILVKTAIFTLNHQFHSVLYLLAFSEVIKFIFFADILEAYFKQSFDFFVLLPLFLPETTFSSFQFHSSLSPRLQFVSAPALICNSAKCGKYQEENSLNKLNYKETVMKRLNYIQILAEQERYKEIQNLLETNFVLVA